MIAIPRGINILDLAKSCFIAGIPGGGKSTLVKFLMLTLHTLGVPFMVIEPRKMEYRFWKKHGAHPRADIRALARDLEFYSLGNESLSPVRLAPLRVPPGVSIDEHIGTVMESFYASIPLEGPLPALLAEAVEELYERFPREGTPPTMTDLLFILDEVMARHDYVGEVRANLRAAIDLRIRSLTRGVIGKVCQCPMTLPDPDRLVKRFSVIEVDKMSDEAMCHCIFDLLSMTRTAIRTRSSHSGGLNFVIILEEAHNIVGPTGDARPSEGSPDPRAYASKYLVRMMTELRSAGVGVVIVDQLPSAVAPEVIKSTAIKIAFRLVDAEDRDQMGSSMLFRQQQDEEIARLGTGEAFVFAPGYHGPCKITTINLNEEVNLDPPSDTELMSIISKEAWYRETARKRTQAEVETFVSGLDGLDKTRMEIAARFGSVGSEIQKVLTQSAKGVVPRPITSKVSEIRGLHERLATTMGEFDRGPWRRFRQGTSEQPDLDGSRAFRTAVADRYTNTIRPDSEQLLRRMTHRLSDLEQVINNRR